MKRYVPKEKIIKVNGSYKVAGRTLSVPFNRKSYDNALDMRMELQKVRNSSAIVNLTHARKFFGYGSVGFASSFITVLFIGLFAMLLISFMSPNTTITFKAFMESLASIRFRNTWLTSLTSISDAFDKLNSFNPELTGGWENVLVIFTSFFEWIFNFGNLLLSVIVGLFNLLMDFVVNIVVILRWLVTFGASIS